MSEKKYELYAGKFSDKINRDLKILNQQNIFVRMQNYDYTIWKESPDEITNRLGWLKSPESTMALLPEIMLFVDDIRRSGLQTILLLGMGGSSLAPEVFELIFGKTNGYPDLIVLDTTDPDAIKKVERHLDFTQTLFLVATKSGGTVETISLMKYFFNRVTEAVGLKRAGTFFSAITDPDSGLEKLAKTLNFRKIFLNDPDIGGRYSALSLFGMVPAALIGIDISVILRRAADFAKQTLSSLDQTAAVLGTLMGVTAKKGYDKLTLIGESHWKYMGPWIEQLIAESTGKEGKGILPVDREQILETDRYTGDRIFAFIKDENKQKSGGLAKVLNEAGYPVIEIYAGDKENIGAQFYLWEIATIIASYFLRINPFDQPNVESAKIRSRQLMDKFKQTGKIDRPAVIFTDRSYEIYGDVPGTTATEIADNFIRMNLQQGSYVAIHAYLPGGKSLDDILLKFRDQIRNKFKVTTTLGYGPRFLHSTGQLHKGDAGLGIFLQILNLPFQDIEIPDEPGRDGSSISFGNLRNAQAFGDREALVLSGRKVLTIVLKENVKTLSSLV